MTFFMRKTLILSLLLLVFSFIQFRWLSAQGWSPVGAGLPQDYTTCMAVYNSKLYVGGSLFLPYDQSRDVATWDGNQWAGTGRFKSHSVNCMTVYNSELYVGGYNSPDTSKAMTCISKWNGAQWLPVDYGVGDTSSIASTEYVAAMVEYNGELVVAGLFFSASGVPARSIAKWDGTNWSAMGSGLLGDAHALAVFNGDLYAGGAFTMAGGIPANFIAKWDGTSWSALSSEPNAAVLALCVYNGALYAGGSFILAGGNPASRVARWDGTAWSPVGSGIDNTVLSLANTGGLLYAGGHFSLAGSAFANNVAVWDGSNWAAMQTGMNDNVNCFAEYDSTLYAGGRFTIAGSVAASHIARWDALTEVPNMASEHPFSAFPNPSSGRFTLRVPPTATRIVITDCIGNPVHAQEIHSSSISVNLNDHPRGMYFFSLWRKDQFLENGKLVVE